MHKPMTRDEFMKLVRKFGCMKVAAFQRYKSEPNGDSHADFAEFAAETAEIFEEILSEYDKVVTALEDVDAEIRV